MRLFANVVGLLAVLMFSAALGWAEEVKYAHKIEVEKMTFQWQIEDQNIHIQIAAPTTGWVGIGFNPSDGMKDANFILGYVKNGKATVQDEFGTRRTQHKSDDKLGGQENVTNAAGEEKDGVTTIRFTIPLDSGDAKDQALAADQETTVLLAYGSGRDSFFSRHKVHAQVKVNLKTGKFSQ